jgi:hypothetical protein
MPSSGSFLDPSELLEIPHIRFVFQVTQDDLISTLMMDRLLLNIVGANT